MCHEFLEFGDATNYANVEMPRITRIWGMTGCVGGDDSAGGRGMNTRWFGAFSFERVRVC